jgi:uncharacterized protein
MFDTIRNAHGERLDTAFHPGADGTRDLLVVGHGVTANKDRPFLVALADAVSATGIAVLRVSFAGNGASEGRFEDATIRKEVDDLGAVLDAVEQDGGWRVGYAGHSMGGAVGVLRASRDPRITALISLAGMVHTHEFAQRKFGDQEPGASFMWDKPDCPLSQAFMDDMQAIGSVCEQARGIRIPWLLIHGDADTVVPLRDATDIVGVAQPNAQLIELPGVDHVFGDEGTQRMVDLVVPWLQRTWGR